MKSLSAEDWKLYHEARQWHKSLEDERKAKKYANWLNHVWFGGFAVCCLTGAGVPLVLSAGLVSIFGLAWEIGMYFLAKLWSKLFGELDKKWQASALDYFAYLVGIIGSGGLIIWLW